MAGVGIFGSVKLTLANCPGLPPNCYVHFLSNEEAKKKKKWSEVKRQILHLQGSLLSTYCQVPLSSQSSLQAHPRTVRWKNLGVTDTVLQVIYTYLQSVTFTFDIVPCTP